MTETETLAGAFQKAGEAIADMSSTLAYGSPSIKTWEKRCADSLAASRRRRAYPPHPNALDYAMRALLLLFIAAVVIALIILFSNLGAYDGRG